jgi:predicted acylesterase/phospholipase RssA
MKDITHLVFSGCAFRSFCLLGALRYLYIEKKHINIRNVAGASMGSLFCLAFALKIPYEKMEEIIKETVIDPELTSLDKKSFINLFYKNGIESSHKYLKLIKKYVSERYNVDDMTFLELSKRTGINLFVSSTNINKNINHIFCIDNSPDVSIFDAVASSMTIPYLAYPIEIDNEYYVDGGLTNNFPIYIFKNVPKENILGIAIKIPDDFKSTIYEKGSKLSLFQYTSQICNLVYLNSSHHTLINRLDDNILIIEESPIKDWLNFEIKKDGIDRTISPVDIDNLIVKGFEDIANYMKLKSS